MDTLDVKLMDTKIPLFLNSLDIFAESIFWNFVELSTFMTINASFESPVYTPRSSKIQWRSRASNGSARTFERHGLRLKLLKLGMGDSLLLPLTPIGKQREQETVSHPERE